MDEITEGYVIEPDEKALGGFPITCLRCDMKSYNRNDVDHRYCGNCKAYHAERGSGAGGTE